MGIAAVSRISPISNLAILSPARAMEVDHA